MTKLIRTFVLIGLCSLVLEAAALAATHYRLDAKQSKIEMTAVKNGAVSVKGVFEKMAGEVTVATVPDGGFKYRGEVAVELDSLKTNDATRDMNVRTRFFQTRLGGKFKKARFVLKESPLSKALPAVATKTVLKGTLEMHGVKAPVEVRATVTQKNGVVHVKSSTPIVLEFSKWNLLARVAELTKICGHKSLESKATLSIDLVFLAK